LKKILFSILFTIFLISPLHSLQFKTIAKRSEWLPIFKKTIPSNYINCLGIDNFSGSLYIGTSRGLVWSNGKRFKTYKNGPIGENINDIFFYKKEAIYVASDSGVSVFESRTSKWEYFTTENGLPTDYIQSIARIKNSILIGSWGDGLFHLNIMDGKIKKIKIPKFNGKYITDILTDEKRETIIVSSLKYGIAIRKNNSWKIYSRFNKKLPSNRVNCLFGDGKNFYVGTKAELWSFHLEEGGSTP